ncbi:type I restriction enzyme, R subunit [Paraglaciecola mesophila KMM 241]|uniref:Type I restriction enzyme, R subunit n=1 Tax=Paraglaciecola mesophila KMM 241 TaxID=1128912 RepID=K6Z2R0_9ALTE|nr:type I restriction-modification system endonuclease [Paraglaciecola mesophila]GAC23278.1 type I restriction enzyme, R subunit [Paraglaciecola mesophila KMM 241]
MKKSNFEFLKGVNDILYRIALAAEKNFPDDPNTTLIKLRMFGEASAKNIAKLLDIEIPPTQHDLVRELAKVSWVDDAIINVFHSLRKVGNQAVHDYHNDLDDAEMALRLAYRLSVWYYRLIKNDADFAAPIFVLPAGHREAEYQLEVTELKQALQQALNTNTQTDAELEANKNKLIALSGYISILESKQEETQAQTAARVNALEAELKQKDQELANKTDVERETYKQEITQRAAARRLDLSEKETRFIIDQQLRDAGWAADTKALNYANGTRPQLGKNLAIAEWPTDKDENGDTGFADYVLFVGLKPMGIVEAKKINIDVCAKLTEAHRYSIYFNYEHLNSEILIQATNDPINREKIEGKIAEQSKGYLTSWPESQQPEARRYKIPFVFSANGRNYQRQILTKSGIWYRDVRNVSNDAKALPAWHTPGELKAKLASDNNAAHKWLENNKPTDLGLRYFQEEAVTATEQAIKKGQQNILLAMATGTGKTRTAIALMYRLVQSRRFNRVLFLVDRRSLGEQALNSFDDTRINDVPFNTIFNIKGFTDKFPSGATKIHVATIQSLVKRTLQSDEFMPVERYDCIIVDEAHRGYILDKEQTDGEMEFRDQLDYVSTYRRILDHFDAVKIGLTATPALHTTKIFGLPVYRYSYRKAVIDGYLTDQEPPIKIVTKLNRDGIYLDKGTQVTRLTNQGELVEDTLEDEQDFEVANFNRDIIAPSFTKVVAESLAGSLNPTGHQKTLIFCVNNTHADMVVEELRAACKVKYPSLEHDAIIKITGTSDKDPKKIQSIITRFKKERLPNIVVTVDLLTTGIDIPSICNLVFLRKVKSRILYEQMKGRATRLCPEVGKNSFKIYDAVNLYDTLESVDTMRPVVVRPKVELKTLVNEIADPETYKTLEADGRSFAVHSHEQLVAKVQRIVTHGLFNREKSTGIEQSIKRLDETLEQSAGCNFASLAHTLKSQGPEQSAVIFSQLPKLIENLEDLKMQINELRGEPIFTDIDDELIEMKQGFGEYDTPQDFLEAFDNLVAQSENKKAALRTVIAKPKDLTRKALLELQEWFDAQSFDESTLRVAWQKTTNRDIAARLIGHIRRAALGDALLPFDQRVDNALHKIQQQKDWNPEQLSWLERLANSLKEQVAIDDDTFKTGNYKRRGGKQKLEAIFDGKLEYILEQFNDFMWEQPA